MDEKQATEFETALTNLQHILIARRVLASDEKVRLNWNHFHILILVKNSPNILPSEISSTLKLSRSTTSKHLKYLKDNDLIATIASKDDLRSYAVDLTPLAATILDNIFKGQRDNARLALSVLTQEEAERFVQISEKIIAALGDESLKEV